MIERTTPKSRSQLWWSYKDQKCSPQLSEAMWRSKLQSRLGDALVKIKSVVQALSSTAGDWTSSMPNPLKLGNNCRSNRFPNLITIILDHRLSCQSECWPTSMWELIASVRMILISTGLHDHLDTWSPSLGVVDLRNIVSILSLQFCCKSGAWTELIFTNSV